MFVFGVDYAVRVIGIVEFDDVIARMVGRAGELQAKRIIQPSLEVATANFVPADPDVIGKKVDVGVQISHIQRKRVFRDQLPDCVDSFEPVQSFLQVFRQVGHGAKLTYRLKKAYKTTQMNHTG